MTELSDFAKALKARKRRCYEFDVSGFYGMAGEAVAKVAIRVATKHEQDCAVVEAHRYAKSLAGKELQEAAQDRDILEEAKTAYILSSVVRDANRPDEMPCFVSGDVMMKEQTVDQLAVLLNLYEEVKAKESPYKPDLAHDRLMAIKDRLADAAGTDIPEAGLAGWSRPELTHALVLLSVEMKRVESELSALRALSDAG